MKRSLLVLIALVFLIACHRKPTFTQKEIDSLVMVATLDSLLYGKEDYEQMTAGFLRDTFLIRLSDEKIAGGDVDEIRFRKMLQTPYEQRFGIDGLSEYRVKLAVFLFRKMKKSTQEFDSI